MAAAAAAAAVCVCVCVPGGCVCFRGSRGKQASKHQPKKANISAKATFGEKSQRERQIKTYLCVCVHEDDDDDEEVTKTTTGHDGTPPTSSDNHSDQP